ncbi:hypothetical protein DFJ63DRAFT_22406 [Scheffersomyces coipomensis]|uniref:uncharacterized protein n=1 Tax=Scheffersomyces coipomensis TaxID=1788519 RepID=UPI00315D6A4A
MISRGGSRAFVGLIPSSTGIEATRLRTFFLNPIYLQSSANQLHQTRYRSWFNPLSRFNNTKDVIRHDKPSIIEEPTDEKQTKSDVKLEEMRHLLRSSDSSVKSRHKLLATVFAEYIENKESITTKEINEIDTILNGVDISIKQKGATGLLDYYTVESLIQLFELTATSLLNEGQTENNDDNRSPIKRPTFRLPKYMVKLIENFSSLDMKDLPISLFTKIVDIGATLKDYETVIYSLIISRRDEITPEFSNELIHYYKDVKVLSKSSRERLVMDIFEIFIQCSIKIPNANIIDDRFRGQFIQYIESLFQDRPPFTHAYKNLERSVDRIQYLTCQMLSKIKFNESSPVTLVKLTSFSSELTAAGNNQELSDAMIKTLASLVEQSKENNFDIIKDVIFQQDLDSESVCENLLFMAWNNQQFHQLGKELSEFIIANEVKFSSILRFQSTIYNILHSELPEDMDLSEVITYTVEDFKEKDSFIDLANAYTRIMQAIITSDVSPTSEAVKAVTRYFTRDLQIEISPYAYKYRIDKAIQKNDCEAAVTIFDESLTSTLQWQLESDPVIFKTLNDLIVLVCSDDKDAASIFPIFTRIKQSMVRKCNVEAITALSKKMLEVEYVGDLIEMLKRELPTIDKDSRVRLPIDKPYGAKYLQLFNVLHDFVIQYTNEETFETNWVLYGEIQRYFNIPDDRYLPALEFFSEKGRLNAALLIFRRIRQNSDYFDFAPPSRDIYMYLFKVFGENLYEDGVNELYSYLNLDTKLDSQDIELQNQALNAFANLQDVPRARDLFLSMSSNPKKFGGVNEKTIQIMIKAYTYHDLAYVQRLWNNLSQFDIIPDHNIYKQYLIAYVYHGYAEEAIKRTQDIQDLDLEMTTDILLDLNNFCFEERGQKVIVEWAQSTYPELWQKVVDTGLLRSATKYMPSTNLIAGQKEEE